MSITITHTCDSCGKSTDGSISSWKQVYVFDGIPYGYGTPIKKLLELAYCDDCSSTSNIEVKTKSSVKSYFRRK